MSDTVGTLYHNPITRSSKIVWLSTELGFKLNIKVINVATGEHKQPEFLKVNPRGQLPVFEDNDGFSLVESNAILLHLLDKCDKDYKFGGKHGSDQRAHLYKWCVWTAGNDKVAVDSVLHSVVLPEPMRDKQVYADSVKKWNEGVGDALLKELGDKKFFWGDQLTAVDIPIVFMLRAAMGGKLLEEAKWKPLKEYFQRIASTASYKKVYEQ